MRSPIRRLLRPLLVITVIAGAIGTIAPAASAALSNTPDPTWMTNGIVYAIVRSGDRIYVGGRFTSVRSCPPGQACGAGNTMKVSNVAALDATTGAAIKTWKPAVTGDGTPITTVYALAATGGKIFIGGDFDQVAGVARTNFAAVDAITGALDPNVDAAVGTTGSKSIRALLANGSRVFAGGYFTSVDGTARIHVAAFDLDGSLAAGWRARAKGTVKSLAFDCTGATIFVGGTYAQASGTGQPYVAREDVARFDVGTGAIHPWAIPEADLPNSVPVLDMAAACDRLFLGIGGSNWLYTVDLTDDVGDALWLYKTGGNVQTVAIFGDLVVFGGHFSQVELPSGVREKRTRFGAADFDGNLHPWAPTFDGQFYGPWDILATGNQMWIGGRWTAVSGVPQYNLARFTDA
jgi:hypothetical protein